MPFKPRKSIIYTLLSLGGIVLIIFLFQPSIYLSSSDSLTRTYEFYFSEKSPWLAKLGLFVLGYYSYFHLALTLFLLVLTTLAARRLLATSSLRATPLHVLIVTSIFWFNPFGAYAYYSNTLYAGVLASACAYLILSPTRSALFTYILLSVTLHLKAGFVFMLTSLIPVVFWNRFRSVTATRKKTLKLIIVATFLAIAYVTTTYLLYEYGDVVSSFLSGVDNPNNLELNLASAQDFISTIRNDTLTRLKLTGLLFVALYCLLNLNIFSPRLRHDVCPCLIVSFLTLLIPGIPFVERFITPSIFFSWFLISITLLHIITRSLKYTSI
jgi:hypothetical protein